VKKFIRFSFGGAITYGLRIVLTFILTDFFKMWYLLSYSATTLIILIFGFFYNFYFTFKNVEHKRNKFIVYGVSLVLFSLVDISFVKILTDNFELYYLVSIIISTSMIFLVKYSFYNKFVFVEYGEKGGNYFDKHASKNQIVKILLNKFYKNLFFFMDQIKFKSLLEVGCGEGYVINVIKKKFPKISVRGIEVDDATLKKAITIHPNLDFKKGNIYKIDLKDNSFDVILSVEVLEHLTNPEKAIKECKRVSKNYCIFSVPNEPYWRLANILRLSYLPRFGNTPGHVQNWTKKQFNEMLKKQFKKVTVKNSILWNIALCEK